MTYGIVARVGSDKELVELDADQQFDLQLGLDAEADISFHSFRQSLSDAGIVPDRLSEELLVLATTVFAADTRIARSHGADGWTREIKLSIPVADVALWTGTAEVLERALRFLTGDIWTISFRRKSSSLSLSASDPSKAERPKNPRVCLFSGGLDSFIGALDLVAGGSPTVLVGHYTDGSVSAPQARAFSHVTRVKAAKQDVILTQAYTVAPRDLFDQGNEDTQRSRSFLFIALGAMVSRAVGATHLIVPENGLISLNVPLTDLRIGTFTTRTTHPHFIAILQSVLSQVGMGITLTNPYQFKTKGEMLVECAIQENLADASAQTMSCAHPTAGRWRKGASALQHCGRCMACLIRRAAFLRAFGGDPTSYIEQDLAAMGEVRSDTARGRDIRSVRLAAQRVVNDPGVAELLVLKPGPLGNHYAEYADLYVRGMRELWNLVQPVQTRGKY